MITDDSRTALAFRLADLRAWLARACLRSRLVACASVSVISGGIVRRPVPMCARLAPSLPATVIADPCRCVWHPAGVSTLLRVGGRSGTTARDCGTRVAPVAPRSPWSRLVRRGPPCPEEWRSSKVAHRAPCLGATVARRCTALAAACPCRSSSRRRRRSALAEQDNTEPRRPCVAVSLSLSQFPSRPSHSYAAAAAEGRQAQGSRHAPAVTHVTRNPARVQSGIAPSRRFFFDCAG